MDGKKQGLRSPSRRTILVINTVPIAMRSNFLKKERLDSKFYINKDTPSIFYSQRSSGPMHFRKNGQWITIDTRLSPKGPLLYEASNQEDPLGF